MGDFDEVYSMLRDKLAGVPMERMWDRLRELSYKDDNFARIADFLANRRHNGSTFYSKFMSNFYGDQGKVMSGRVEHVGF